MRKENLIIPKDSFNYYGSVKIETKKGDITLKTTTYHNEGGSALFYFIAQCLLGNWSNSGYPQYLRIVGIKDGVIASKSKSNFPISNKYLSYEDGKYSASFVFLVPDVSFSHSKDTGEQVCLGLYSSANSSILNVANYSAIREWGDFPIGDADIDVIHVITWNLIVENGEGNEENTNE